MRPLLIAIAASALLASSVQAGALSPLPSQLQAACNVTAFGAKGDNATEDTAAIQQAIASCSQVVLPAPGVYLTRPLNLSGRANLTLTIEPGATLIAWPDVNTYNTSAAVRALLWSDNNPIYNVSLTGGGVIDGQGWRWWPFMKTRSRPALISIDNGQGLLISNLTLKDSPSFNVAVRGAFMELSWLTIEANASGCDGYMSAPNTDGLNIGGNDIWVHDCWVHNGDDCIPTNVGVRGASTYNVLVERVHCECGTNGPVLILGNYSGGGNIYNVTYRDMVVRGTNQGSGGKISEPYMTGRFASAWDITYSNISIQQPRYAALYFDVYSEDVGTAACKPPANPSRGSNWLSGTNFTFSNITATVQDGQAAGCFLCAPDKPCEGWQWDNVQVLTANGSVAAPYGCSSVQTASDGTPSSPAPCSSGVASGGDAM